MKRLYLLVLLVLFVNLVGCSNNEPSSSSTLNYQYIDLNIEEYQSTWPLRSGGKYGFSNENKYDVDTFVNEIGYIPSFKDEKAFYYFLDTKYHHYSWTEYSEYISISMSILYDNYFLSIESYEIETDIINKIDSSINSEITYTCYTYPIATFYLLVDEIKVMEVRISSRDQELTFSEIQDAIKTFNSLKNNLVVLRGTKK